MAAEFTLDLTHDGVTLLHRTVAGWEAMGTARLDAPDFEDRVNWLSRQAASLGGPDVACRIVLPDSQILYTQVPASGLDRVADERRVRLALDGSTPYALQDLVYDWHQADGTLFVAVVARETLLEAASFARSRGFAPVHFVADQVDGFPAAPDFGNGEVAPEPPANGHDLPHVNGLVVDGPMDEALPGSADMDDPSLMESDIADTESVGRLVDAVEVPEPEVAAEESLPPVSFKSLRSSAQDADASPVGEPDAPPELEPEVEIVPDPEPLEAKDPQAVEALAASSTDETSHLESAEPDEPAQTDPASELPSDAPVDAEASAASDSPDEVPEEIAQVSEVAVAAVRRRHRNRRRGHTDLAVPSEPDAATAEAKTTGSPVRRRRRRGAGKANPAEKGPLSASKIHDAPPKVQDDLRAPESTLDPGPGRAPPEPTDGPGTPTFSSLRARRDDMGPKVAPQLPKGLPDTADLLPVPDRPSPRIPQAPDLPPRLAAALDMATPRTETTGAPALTGRPRGSKAQKSARLLALEKAIKTQGDAGPKPVLAKLGSPMPKAPTVETPDKEDAPAAGGLGLKALATRLSSRKRAKGAKTAPPAPEVAKAPRVTKIEGPDAPGMAEPSPEPLEAPIPEIEAPIPEIASPQPAPVVAAPPEAASDEPVAQPPKIVPPAPPVPSRAAPDLPDAAPSRPIATEAATGASAPKRLQALRARLAQSDVALSQAVDTPLVPKAPAPPPTKDRSKRKGSWWRGKSKAPVVDGTPPAEDPPPRKPLQPVRRADLAGPVPAPIGIAPSKAKGLSEAETLTVFGARRQHQEKATGQGARYLGLVMTLGLVGLMALAGLWTLWVGERPTAEAPLSPSVAAIAPAPLPQGPDDSIGGLATTPVAPTTPAPDPIPEVAALPRDTAPLGQTDAATAPTAPDISRVDPAPSQATPTAPQAPSALSGDQSQSSDAVDLAALGVPDTAPRSTAPPVAPAAPAPIPEAAPAPTPEAAPAAEPDAVAAVAPAQPSLSEPNVAPAVEPPAANDPLAAVPPLPEGPLDPSVAEAIHGRTGIWQRTPDARPAPPEDRLGSLPAAQSVPGRPAAAPPTIAQLTGPADAALPPQAAPLRAESPAIFGPGGRVEATPEGVLSPDGVTIILGRPDILPPRRITGPDGRRVVVPQAEPEFPVDPLEGFRPKRRPDDLTVAPVQEPPSDPGAITADVARALATVPPADTVTPAAFAAPPDVAGPDQIPTEPTVPEDTATESDATETAAVASPTAILGSAVTAALAPPPQRPRELVVPAAQEPAVQAPVAPNPAVVGRRPLARPSDLSSSEPSSPEADQAVATFDGPRPLRRPQRAATSQDIAALTEAALAEALGPAAAASAASALAAPGTEGEGAEPAPPLTFPGATELAVAAAPKPRLKPSNIGQIADRARRQAEAERAAAQTTAAAATTAAAQPQATAPAAVQAAPASAASASVASASARRGPPVPRNERVTPRVPSSASVARQATIRNAVSLSKVALIGVYGTPNARRALVRLPSGRYIKVKVGDRIDNGRVSSIGEGELSYERRGQRVVLKMPRG